MDQPRANGVSDTSLDEQLRSFRLADEARLKFLTDLIRKYEELKTENTHLVADYQNELSSRRHWQGQVESARNEAINFKRTVESSSFAIALIDGDTAPFQDQLYQAGATGGAEAAHKLNLEIKRHLRTIYGDDCENWRILVQIYTNMGGLSRTLSACGVAHNANFLDFIHDFNTSQPLFSIVDVGYGKERADHNVRESFNFYVNNPLCRHIIFGGAHDKGYLNMLRAHQFDDNAARITVLSTYVDLTETKALDPFHHAQIASVFRDKPLPTAATSSTAPITRGTVIESSRSYNDENVPSSALPPVRTRSSTGVAVGDAPSERSEDGTWAKVGAGGTIEKKISIAPVKTPARPFIVLNKDKQRLDKPVAVSNIDKDSLYQKCRANGTNFCNSFYLDGKCNQYGCALNHKGKLSTAEVNVIRYLARGLRCHKGLGCRDVKCYLGHACPFSNSCTSSKCKFYDEEHEISLEPKFKYFDENTLQAV